MSYRVPAETRASPKLVPTTSRKSDNFSGARSPLSVSEAIVSVMDRKRWRQVEMPHGCGMIDLDDGHYCAVVGSSSIVNSLV